MKYTEFIKGNEGFQYSINIQFDFNNENKIKGYIPTRSSVDVLKTYMENTTMGKEQDRATVLIGPYGKGKSHLLLVLLSLMCGNPSENINKLVKKIENIDNNCGDMAANLLNNKRYLPIILNFNSDDLNQSFLVAIKHALIDAGREDMLPTTYFDAACNVINGWENYPSTYKKFKSLVKEKANMKIAEFIRKIELFDRNSYEVFKDVFKEITSGVDFNPLLNTDIVKLIEQTNHNLKEKYGYDGIIIIFDEFSKFIESSEESNNARDLKILQDLAELSNRSTSPQLHLVCITHKTINEYISKIPQEKIDAWRAIEGRFKEVFFNSTSQQNYELIANAIQKDEEKLDEYILENKEKLDELTSPQQDILFPGDYKGEDYFKQIVRGCFPLDPYTTFALPIVSEKVAQNERTLFTYLSKDEPNSLVNILKKNKGELKLISLDTLYDYFEILFKKEIFNETIHNIWLKVDTSIKIVHSNLEKRILKVLGIIYIINDFKSISPSKYNLECILNIKNKSLEDTLNKMINLGILFLKESDETLEFMPNSSVNVNKDIKNLAETKFMKPKIAKDLNEIVNFKFILPKKYNDDYKITRFFKRAFITIEEILVYDDAEQLLIEYKSDGIILDLIYFNKSEIKEVEEWLEKIDDNRILVVIPDNCFSILNDISKYETVNYLKSNIDYLKEDKEVENQLEIIYEDVTAKVIKYIKVNYDVSDDKCKIFINKHKYKNMKTSSLSLEISKICSENFKFTPVINNELINKNRVSPPVHKASDFIVKSLLDGSYVEFDETKSSLEGTLFRTTLTNQGLLNGDINENSNMGILINEIKEFFRKAEDEELSFKELYDNITTNMKGIGIRKGIIPIYLAYVLKNYNDEVVLYLKSGRTKKEVDLECGTINNINSAPNEYSVRIEKGTDEKNIYLDKMLDIFNEYSNNKSSGNKFKDIVNAMKGWLQSLCLYSKNYIVDISNGEQIEDSIIKLRKELFKFEINSRQFILKDLLKILEVDTLERCSEKIFVIKNILDSHIIRVKDYLEKEIKSIIDENYNGSVSNTIRNWFNNLDEDKKTYLFSGTTKEFIDFIPNMGNNHGIIVDRIALIFTNLSLEDWNDDCFKLFIKELKNSKEIIENLEISNDKNSEGIVKIIIQDENQNPVEKVFNKSAIGENASTLFNSIEEAIDEYGDSVDDNEKRNILMAILQRYI